MMQRASLTQEKLTDLAAKAGQGETAAAAELLELQLKLAHLEVAEAKKRLAALEGLDDEQRTKLNGMILGLEASEIMTKVTRDPATHAAAGEKFAKLVADGYAPEDRNDLLNCWFMISVYAEQAKNVELFTKALETFKAQPGIRPDFLDQMEKKLEKLGGK